MNQSKPPLHPYNSWIAALCFRGANGELEWRVVSAGLRLNGVVKVFRSAWRTKRKANPVSLSLTEYNNICASLGHYLPAQAGEFADTLNRMLSLAENEYGPRDRAFTIWNVEFTRKHPSVYGLRFGAKVVTIILSRSVLALARKGEWRNAYWELAHECVHLLSPPTEKGPIVLEEGVACNFQRRYMQEFHDFERPQKMPCYASAEAKFQELRELDEDIVWKLRQEEPVFRHITSSLILRHCPSAPDELAEALTRPFNREASIKPLDVPVPRPAALVLRPTVFSAWRRP